MEIESLYKDVPREQMDHLVQFRAEHPCRHIEIAGVKWEYIACGTGSETVLILPGGLRIAEHAYIYVEMFEDAYQVIVPTYPPLKSIDEITNGIATILDGEQRPIVFVLGQSYGGMVAQVFIQRFPSKVRKLVLSSTGPLLGSKTQAVIVSILSWLIAKLPSKVVMGMYSGILSKMLTVPQSDALFWRAYLKDLFSKRLTKADVISHFKTGEDTIKKYSFGKCGESWPGEVLILGGEKDPLSTESDRAAMAKFYPQSQVRLIQDAGHTAGMEEPVKFAEIVKEFFAESIRK